MKSRCSGCPKDHGSNSYSLRIAIWDLFCAYVISSLVVRPLVSCLLYLTNPFLPCSILVSGSHVLCPVFACIAATVFASRVPVLRCSGVSVPVSFLSRCVGPVSVHRACLPVVSFSCAVARRPPWGPCVMSHTTVWSCLVPGLVAEPMAYLSHICFRVTFDVFVFFLHRCCTLGIIMFLLGQMS